MQKPIKWIFFAFIAIILFKLFFSTDDSSPQTQQSQQEDIANADLVIVSGSENKGLQPLIDQWAKREGKKISVVYKGSVDIYRLLQQGQQMPYDAVWPANHLWIELGDTQKVVKHEQSIMRSPVVLGMKKSIVERLGWDKKPVKIQDILDAAENKQFRLSMTSATQSNSGASAYFGFLYAMAGYPDTLSAEHLQNPDVQNKVKRLLATVDRSSGSSGWLKEAFQNHPERFDAMFNYEALIIEANQHFTRTGGEPLYAIYPQDGLSVADSPLGYVDKGDADKEALFMQLQAHLLSAKVQKKIETMGRRTGLLGMTVSNPDKAVWNPAWGINADVAVASIPVPQQAVIRDALSLYQTDLRKPSLTIWVLDVSGSMQGQGIADLKRAMTTLLDPKQAADHLLQAGSRDVTIIIPFNNDVVDIWTIEGNSEQAFAQALSQVNSLRADGGTDLYEALIIAMQQLQPWYAEDTLWDYLPAIVAMTDGRSNDGNWQNWLQTLQTLPYGNDVPVHAIAFGNADEQQMKALTEQSVGRFFKVEGDLAGVLRKAKGYN